MANITTRPATAEDADFARRVHHEAYRELIVRRYGPWNEVTQDEFFKQSWEKGTHEIIMSSGVPCGYYFVERKEGYFFLSEILILPEFQGKGIGTKVLEDLIEKSKTEDIPLRLQVFKENKAQDLYRRLGFRDLEPTGSHFQLEFNPSEK